MIRAESGTNNESVKHARVANDEVVAVAVAAGFSGACGGDKRASVRAWVRACMCALSCACPLAPRPYADTSLAVGERGRSHIMYCANLNSCTSERIL